MVMRVVLYGHIFALLLLSAATASAQFLRKGTHNPPIFYNENRMNHYFVDQDWAQDVSQLAPLASIDIPFEWAQGWIKDKRTFSRALVMGQPESCPLMTGVYAAPDQETAARIAFTSCFYQLQLMEGHQKENCGCQLAMVDEMVFIEADSFTNFAASPAVVSFDDKQDDILGIVYFGDDLFGQDQDIRFVDSKGITRCRGKYNINFLLFNELKMTCDFLCEAYDGPINIMDFAFKQNGFRPMAVVKGQTCEGNSVEIKVGKMAGE